jgi:YidC/Oxa1 family membrane protein insertase
VNSLSQLLAFLGNLLAPIGAVFHAVFYEPIFNLLMLLYEGVHALIPSPAFPSFAIAIFLLTVIIRLCLYPLTRKQLQSSRAMQALAPQVEELKRRYRNNPQELMAAQQALYREHGVSMYGGCLPLLIQMPFLYALYFSFSTVLLAHGLSPAQHLLKINQDIYPFLPHLTLATIPNPHFLWTNLTAPDPWKILPVLAGLLTFLQLRMAQPVKKPTPAGQRSDSTTQAMSSMQFIMPFITFFMGLSFPSGLAFYWTISTAFSAVQQYFLTGFGSLFVGIPRLAHLVPEPQSPPAPAGRPAAASSIVDAQAPARPAGLGGFGALLRQLTAPTQEAGKPGSTNGVGKDGTARGNGTSKANGRGMHDEPGAQFASSSGMEGADGSAGGTAKRPRVDRSGPTLVKPPSAGQSAGNGTSVVGKKNGSGQTSTQSAGGGVTRGSANGSGSARRPTGGSGSQGGSSGRRRPGNRPKGGR